MKLTALFPPSEIYGKVKAFDRAGKEVHIDRLEFEPYFRNARSKEPFAYLLIDLGAEDLQRYILTISGNKGRIFLEPIKRETSRVESGGK